jgi:microcystin-dependent protein
MEPYIGEIKMFGGNFAPRGYASCNGQLLSIAQNSALFSLLGTTYGGNGQTNFGLPNMQGRMPTHYGSGPGLPPVSLGQVYGSPNVNLNTTNLPAHIHTLSGTVNVVGNPGTSRSPMNAYIAGDAGGDANYVPDSVSPTGTLAPGTMSLTIGMAGGSQPVNIQSPGLGVNFIVALQGIFPPRS